MSRGFALLRASPSFLRASIARSMTLSSRPFDRVSRLVSALSSARSRLLGSEAFELGVDRRQEILGCLEDSVGSPVDLLVEGVDLSTEPAEIARTWPRSLLSLLHCSAETSESRVGQVPILDLADDHGNERSLFDRVAVANRGPRLVVCPATVGQAGRLRETSHRSATVAATNEAGKEVLPSRPSRGVRLSAGELQLHLVEGLLIDDRLESVRVYDWRGRDSLVGLASGNHLSVSPREVLPRVSLAVDERSRILPTREDWSNRRAPPDLASSRYSSTIS